MIPEVVGPVLAKRTGTEREFEMPERCPVCQTPIVRDEGAVRHYCPNLACPARVAQEFAHFAGRGGMDIEGAGWAVLEQLLQRGLVKTRGDFYRLTVEDLESLDRFARKSAENLACLDRTVAPAAARADRQRARHPAGRVADGDRPRRVAGRSVPAGGRRADGRPGRLDGQGCRGVARLAVEDPTAFQAVPGVGAVVAESVARYFADPVTGGQLAELVAAGVEAERPVAQAPGADGRPLAGQTLVVTGTLEGSAARRPKRRSGPPAARPAVPCRARPTTSWPVRTPGRSWPRRRNSASRCSTRRRSGGCLAGEPPPDRPGQSSPVVALHQAGDRAPSALAHSTWSPRITPFGPQRPSWVIAVTRALCSNVRLRPPFTAPVTR